MNKRKVEFRIPISPTDSFYSQVRLFNFALRRLGPPYDDAYIRVAVGNCCDIDEVRSLNRWSEDFNVEWLRVPDEIFRISGIWGTADWRLNIPSADADVIILSDADTILVRNIDDVVADLSHGLPAVRGHMAHFPPPCTAEDVPTSGMPEFWPWIFERFGAVWREPFSRYSMDTDQKYPISPAYFNLGFVALNSAALEIFDRNIQETEIWIKKLVESHMRCQIAVTLIAYREGIDIGCLPAEYNAANDMLHINAQNIDLDDVRVIHYLRNDEFDRSDFLLPSNIDDFLAKKLSNPINRKIQAIVQSFRESLKAKS